MLHAPNQDQIPFLTKLSSHLTRQRRGELLVGGDFNSILDVDLDRSSPQLQGAVSSKIAGKLSEWMSYWGLVDIWREQHLHDRDYSYYSGLHRLHTRIDRVACTADLARGMVHSEYLGRTLSDHNPLLVTWMAAEIRPPIPAWRLSPTALEDPAYRDTLRQHLTDHIQFNSGSTTSRSTEWEALKVATRGFCLGQSAGVRRTPERELTKLEKIIHEGELNQGAGTLVNEKYNQAKRDHSQIEEQLRCHSTQKYFASLQSEEGRSGKMLAWLVRPGGEAEPITNVLDKEGTCRSRPGPVNDAFKEYYTFLYGKPAEISTEVFDNYLQHIPITNLMAEDRDRQGGPVTMAEVSEAIAQLASGKTPGTDGLPMDFYKKIEKQLTPQLVEMYTESLQNGIMPCTMREAMAVPLPKTKSRQPSVTDFRPLSMLNSDFKILSKILANRLLPLVPTLVHVDQNGFVPNRSTSLNLRRLFAVLNMPSDTKPTAGVLLAVDFEKAFDSIRWDYLKAVMLRMGMGEDWVKWVDLLYTSPLARVTTGKTVSGTYPVHRGTRQGCPLSPLLFALAIEPLASQMRQEGVDRGVEWGHLAIC
ncbi:hypothetical protein NDU88_002864 [Pleurodeles waltl]|uniref:Reverse transcriptase domain-containing protein n=1 Tax=Pleurodeles waltl TaxID=8319 RepID=A0AAV7T4V2_PLEWA|nr:hypothetical protein NDU88_002864 [Pleurodeles waltl]